MAQLHDSVYHRRAALVATTADTPISVQTARNVTPEAIHHGR